MADPQTDSRIRRLVRQQLLALKSFGLHEWAKPSGRYQFEALTPSDTSENREAAARQPDAKTVRAQTDRPAQSTPKRAIPSQANPGTPSDKVTENYPASLDVSEREERFKVLNATIAACTRCSTLCHHRTQTVFGVGNLTPRLVFLGEAPGEDEDKQGEPFVGRAGQLLTKIIQAMQLSRSDVYILNTVKCRPPMNRNPSEDELANCWEYLVAQLDVLQPEIICCLGSVAARRLLNTTQSIGRLRGRFFRYKDSKVAVTYHPSYLLRMENQTVRGISPKRMVWDDMKMILAELGLGLDGN